MAEPHAPFSETDSGAQDAPAAVEHAMASESAQNSERREELDDLIHKAQELVRNLDTLSMTAAPEMTESARAHEPQTIEELDQEIASSLDHALHDHHSAVDAVLDTVFEEQAAIVQQINQPLPPPPLETVPVPIVAAPPVEQTIAPEAQQPAPEPPAAIAAAPEAAPPAALNALDDAAATPADAKQEQVPLPEVAAIEAQPSSLPQRSSSTIPRPSIGAIARKIAKPAVPVLMVVNYPLRLVPASMRSAVDWLALTLLIWVPIVWIMVFALGGSDGAIAHEKSDEVAASSTSHGKHDSHESSGHESAHGGH